MTTKGAKSFVDFDFEKNDIILMGRESAGVPDGVHNMADARLLIPMNPEARSINMAISAAMALSEGLRQTNLFPSIKK
jgi:tRNA (cytidine/uridine-2'-O-)-methyltransferase